MKGNKKFFSKDVKREYDNLIKYGFLRGDKVKKTEHPMSPYVKNIITKRLSSLVLQVTQNCNLRCSYCVYSGKYKNRVHSNKRMTKKMAFKAIDFLKSCSVDSEKVDIAFYGGEPLLEINLIKECIGYAEKIMKDKEIHFNMTSNATLLTLELYEYFRKHNVTVTISLDGPKEIHDINRRYAKNDEGSHIRTFGILQEIYESYPEDIDNHVIINTVADQGKSFRDINNFFMEHEVFKKVQVTFSMINDSFSLEGEKNVSNTFLEEYRYEMFKMYLKIFGRLDSKYISPLLQTNETINGIRRIDRRIRSRISEISHHAGPCIPGHKSLFVNVNGEFYPCERVPEGYDLYKIGDINEGFYMDNIIRMLNIEKCMSKTCRSCWAYEYCTMCIANSNCLNSLDEDSISNKCPFIKNEVEIDFKNYCLMIEQGYDFDLKGIRNRRKQHEEFNVFTDNQ